MFFCFLFTVERYPNGTLYKVAKCMECSPGTEPSANGNGCVPCSQVKIVDKNSKCTCPLDFTNVRGKCISSNILKDWPDERSSYVITYENGKKIDSQFLRDHLLQAISMCKVSERKRVGPSGLNLQYERDRTCTDS